MATTAHCINNFNITEYIGNNIYIFNNVFDKDFCNNIIKLMDVSECKKKSFAEYNNVECFDIDKSNYNFIIGVTIASVLFFMILILKLFVH